MFNYDQHLCHFYILLKVIIFIYSFSFNVEDDENSQYENDLSGVLFKFVLEDADFFIIKKQTRAQHLSLTGFKICHSLRQYHQSF